MAGFVTMENGVSPSTTKSSVPVAVTVWGTFQFAAVNVRVVRSTVPSVGVSVSSVIVTSATGLVSSTIVNESVPPASVVVRPPVGVTVMPATSLSVFVAFRSAGSTPEKLGSALTIASNTTK